MAEEIRNTVVSERMKKIAEYRLYIEQHRKNVRTAWKRLKELNEQHGNPLGWIEENEIIETLIDNHDMSKYDSDEFDAYRMKFFPTTEEESRNAKDLKEYGNDWIEENFDRAWDRHQNRNGHHWQFMSKHNFKLPNLYELTIEMICDWYAMAMYKGEGHRDYYNLKKDEIILQDRQRDLIEACYNLFDKYETE